MNISKNIIMTFAIALILSMAQGSYKTMHDMSASGYFNSTDIVGWDQYDQTVALGSLTIIKDEYGQSINKTRNIGANTFQGDDQMPIDVNSGYASNSLNTLQSGALLWTWVGNMFKSMSPWAGFDNQNGNLDAEDGSAYFNRLEFLVLLGLFIYKLSVYIVLLIHIVILFWGKISSA